jgi:thioredoxin reductase (NADPH)
MSMAEKEGVQLIIIGAGPAGISMAVEARAAGISREKILLLEKAEAHSWSIRKFYPDQKLVTANYKGFDAVCHGVMCILDMSKQQTLSYLDRAIEEHELKVHYKETVGTILQKEEGGFTLTTDRNTYDTKVCAIAIGILGRPNKPKYPIPSSLKLNVHYDLTSIPIENSTVLVIGGGDSASEYAQYLAEKSNRVTLSYRGSEFARMNDINSQSLLALEAEGRVAILRSSNIVAVEETGGRPKVTFAEEAYGQRAYDHIVYALGGTTPQNFLRAIGIEFKGEAAVIKEGFETNVPGLFLLGDLSAGKKGGSIIAAFNSSHGAMKSICDKYLVCAVPSPAKGQSN